MSAVQRGYAAWAASYDQDRNLTRDLDAAVTREVLAGLRVETVVEIGCGTGKNTGAYRANSRRVLGLDFTRGMLGQARARHGDGAHFALADLTRPWPCPSAGAGLVAGNLVLEHVADLDWPLREAARVLARPGLCFLSELHPFRQYQGRQARFEAGDAVIEIPAFVHHLTDYLQAAEAAGFRLRQLREHWHAEDAGRAPRLITFLFEC